VADDLHVQVLLVAERLHLFAQTVHLMKGDERQVVKLLRPNRGPADKPVLTGKSHEQRLRDQFFRPDQPVVDGQTRDRHIKPAVNEIADQALRQTLADYQGRIGMLRAEALDRAWHDKWRDGGNKADRQRPVPLTDLVAQGVLGVLNLGQDRPGAGQQHPPGIGQDHPARQAIKQRRVKLLFQLHDLLADGWLGDIAALGSPAEAACLRYRHKIDELVDFHSYLTHRQNR